MEVKNKKKTKIIIIIDWLSSELKKLLALLSDGLDGFRFTEIFHGVNYNTYTHVQEQCVLFFDLKYVILPRGREIV